MRTYKAYPMVVEDKTNLIYHMPKIIATKNTQPTKLEPKTHKTTNPSPLTFLFFDSRGFQIDAAPSQCGCCVVPCILYPQCSLLCLSPSRRSPKLPHHFLLRLPPLWSTLTFPPPHSMSVILHAAPLFPLFHLTYKCFLFSPMFCRVLPNSFATKRHSKRHHTWLLKMMHTNTHSSHTLWKP